MVQQVLAEDLARDQEGAILVEHRDERRAIQADHVPHHLRLLEQAWLHRARELLALGDRGLHPNHRTDRVGLDVERPAEQVHPGEIEVEGDQVGKRAGRAGERVHRRDAAAKAGKLRAVGEEVDREAQGVLGHAFELEPELGVVERPAGQVHVADADLVGAERRGQARRPVDRAGAREVGDRASVVPQVLHAAEEASRVEDHIGRAALPEVVGAELVEVPHDLEVAVLEAFARAHPVLELRDPHRDAYVLHLVVDVVARIVDRVDHVEDAEQVGAAPDHLLLADLEEQALAVGQRNGPREVEFANEVEAVVELRRLQLLQAGVHVVPEAAARVGVAGTHRHAEGDSPVGVVQLAPQDDHAVVRVVEQHVSAVEQRDRRLAVRHRPRAQERPRRRAEQRAVVLPRDAVLQRDRSAGPVAESEVVHPVYRVERSPQLHVEPEAGERAGGTELLVGLHLQRVAELREPDVPPAVGVVLVEDVDHPRIGAGRFPGRCRDRRELPEHGQRPEQQQHACETRRCRRRCSLVPGICHERAPLVDGGTSPGLPEPRMPARTASSPQRTCRHRGRAARPRRRDV